MQAFKNAEGKSILLRMVQVIQENKEYLGQIDGVIGDGDHGANMNKGFTMFLNQYKDVDYSFTEGLYHLGMVLLNGICLLYTSPSPRDRTRSRMPSSA